MDLLIQYYDLILIIIVAICGMVFATYKWLSQPSSKQKEQIRTVLLQLVILAESKFGSKTGKVKFSFVYSELLKQLPYLRYIPLSVIEGLVEESLDTMRKLLESNVQVKKIVDGDK